MIRAGLLALTLVVLWLLLVAHPGSAVTALL